jgi:hypothetical protein
MINGFDDIDYLQNIKEGSRAFESTSILTQRIVVSEVLCQLYR